MNPSKYSLPSVAVPTVAAAFPSPVVHICDRRILLLCRLCPVVQFNHTYIECVTPSGVGANKFVRVVVDGQQNSPDETTSYFNYLPPVITNMSAVSANTGPECFNCSSTLVTVTGENFGSPNVSAIVRVANGGPLEADVTRCRMLPYPVGFMYSAGGLCTATTIS